MTATTEKPTIAEAMARVMEEVQAVKKAERNTQQNYSFRGIDAVVNAVGPVLRKHGVICVPTDVQANYRDVQTSTGKPSRECTLTVAYRFYGPAGDFIEAQVPGESMDFGDKGAPKAMSVAYRILLLQALCIPTDDPEADSQTYERADEQTQQERLARAAWVDDISTRIDLASTQTELAAIETECKRAFNTGGLSGEDAKRLRGLIDNRRNELSAPVGA